MRDKKNSALDLPVKIFLHIISLAYAGLIYLWDSAFRSGLFRTRRAGCKVISIGNITVGGTGKTPFTAYLVKALRSRAKKIAVITRGYGDDETRMLRAWLGDTPLIADSDRLRAAGLAVKRFGAEIVILDDGFQHRRIARDVDIVLIDSHEPFGNNYFFPRGVLREPIRALKRADIAVLTKTDFGGDNTAVLRDQLKGYGMRRVFNSEHKALYLYDITEEGRHLALDIISGKKIAVLSSVADPSYFKYILNNLGAFLTDIYEFEDHHNYSEKELACLADSASKNGCAYVVTTEKDAVKIKPYLSQKGAAKILVLKVELEILNNGDQLLNEIFRLLGR